MQTPEDLLKHELADAYDAEHQFLEAMGEMRSKAVSDVVTRLLDNHMKQTEKQISTLEKAFQELGSEPEREPCVGAGGLIEEARKAIGEAETPELRDCVIAGAMSRAEHYELASYSGLIEGAEVMGQPRVVEILESIRDQEMTTLRKIERSTPSLLKAAKSATAS